MLHRYDLLNDYNINFIYTTELEARDYLDAKVFSKVTNTGDKMGKTRKNFYAVQKGRSTGIYETW